MAAVQDLAFADDDDVEMLKQSQQRLLTRTLSRAITSFGPPADEWTASHIGAYTPLTAINLMVSHSGEVNNKKGEAPLLKNVGLRARLGYSLGIFGGTEHARRRLISILACWNPHLDESLYEIKGEVGNDAEITGDQIKSVRFGYVTKNNALYPAATPFEEVQLNVSLL